MVLKIYLIKIYPADIIHIVEESLMKKVDKYKTDPKSIRPEVVDAKVY